MSDKSLKKIRELIGYEDNENHKIFCLNLDERSMFSHRLLAWCSQRFCEATNNFDHAFGSIGVVNLFGDIGQLGPSRFSCETE